MSSRTRSVEGDLCLVLGFLLLFGGFVTFFYDTTGGLYPYRELSVPLFVLGVVSFIAGAFIRTYIKKDLDAHA
jgi:hypothetical protein